MRRSPTHRKQMVTSPRSRLSKRVSRLRKARRKPPRCSRRHCSPIPKPPKKRPTRCSKRLKPMPRRSLANPTRATRQRADHRPGTRQTRQPDAIPLPALVSVNGISAQQGGGGGTPEAVKALGIAPETGHGFPRSCAKELMNAASRAGRPVSRDDQELLCPHRP